MAGYTQRAEGVGEFVDEGEEELGRYDEVDHAGEDFFGQDGVFFYYFGEVVQPAGYGEGEEEEA